MKPVLEPMCGTGRFLIPILEHGIDIEGTDASEDMLNRCKEKCLEKNLSPVLYYQKLQELVIPRKYGFIFIPSGSFGLITDEKDVKKSLNKLYDHLLPKGKLLIEISNPCDQIEKEIICKREVTGADNSKIFLRTTSQFDHKTKVETIKCEYKNEINNRTTLTEKEIIKVRYYEINEFEDLLNSAGFSDIETIRPYTEVKANDEDVEILFKCVKYNKIIY